MEHDKCTISISLDDGNETKSASFTSFGSQYDSWGGTEEDALASVLGMLYSGDSSVAIATLVNAIGIVDRFNRDKKSYDWLEDEEKEIIKLARKMMRAIEKRKSTNP